MNKIWTDEAWNDYIYWQGQDKKTLKKINQLLKDIERNGNLDGIGKPEPLLGNLQGFYSRRINEKDRLVYVIDDEGLNIISCRYYYSKSWNNKRLKIV